jgi:hypothetical protein
VRYVVTIELEDPEAYPNARMARANVDADDRDAALNGAERAYRRMYPDVGRLRVSVARPRPQ